MAAGPRSETHPDRAFRLPLGRRARLRGFQWNLSLGYSGTFNHIVYRRRIVNRMRHARTGCAIWGLARQTLPEQSATVLPQSADIMRRWGKFQVGQERSHLPSRLLRSKKNVSKTLSSFRILGGTALVVSIEYPVSYSERELVNHAKSTTTTAKCGCCCGAIAVPLFWSCAIRRCCPRTSHDEF